MSLEDIEQKLEELKELTGEINESLRITIPGIATASAYTVDDAFGTRFELDVPERGVISTALFIDKDNEGLNKDVLVSAHDFTQTADHDPFAVTDVDLAQAAGYIEFDTWKTYNANQISIATPALYYVAPAGKLFFQFITRGVDNIAAGALPIFVVVIN